MTRPFLDPGLEAWFASLLLLAGAYLLARTASFVLGRLARRPAGGAPRAVDSRLALALQTPVAYALFLLGAYVAVHRLPVHERLLARLDDALFVLGVALLTLAALRAWRILLGWYTDERREAAREGPAHEFGPLFAKAGRVVIALVAAMTVLDHFHVNVASLMISLGVGSLAVGLAAQDTLANMFAGFTLLLDRPFRLGDRIVLATGEVGDVEAIGMRATRIRTLDETILVVPNSTLVKERLVNRSQPTRSITCRLELGVAYGTDLERARAVLAECALSSPYVETGRAPQVLVTRFADSAVNLLVVFWARDYTEQGLAVSSVHEAIQRRFAEAGIEIPYPVRKLIQQAAGPAPAAREAHER